MGLVSAEVFKSCQLFDIINKENTRIDWSKNPPVLIACKMRVRPQNGKVDYFLLCPRSNTQVLLFSPQDDICMHLTNYAVNKHSKDFIRDEETGSKRYDNHIKKDYNINNYN